MAKQETTKPCIITLGMHRSGTSLLSGMLHALGVDLGQAIMAPNSGNPKGYFENDQVMHLNNRVMDTMGFAWDDPFPWPDQWWRDDRLIPLELELTQILASEFAPGAMIGFKDPRICLLLPWWQGCLKKFGYNPVYPIAVRHPLEVAASLAARNDFTTEKSVLLWMNHMLAAELLTRRSRRAFMVYPDLLQHPLETLSKALGKLRVKTPATIEKKSAHLLDLVDKDLRHHARPDDGNTACLALASRLFEQLATMARADRGRKENDLHIKALDEIRSEYTQLQNWFCTREFHAAEIIARGKRKAEEAAARNQQRINHAKLFIHTGSGFNSRQGVSLPFGHQITSLVYDLDHYSGIKEFRFDPGEDMVILHINRIELLDQSGQTHALSPSRSNALFQVDQDYFFDTEDPQIFIPCLQAKPTRLTIYLDIVARGRSTVEPMLRTKRLAEIQEKNRTTSLLERKLGEMEKLTQQLRNDLSQRDGKITALNDSLNNTRNELRAVVTQRDQHQIRLQEITVRMEEKRQEILALTTQSGHDRQKIGELSAQLASASDENNRLNQQIVDLRQQREQDRTDALAASETRTRLEAQIAKQNNTIQLLEAQSREFQATLERKVNEHDKALKQTHKEFERELLAAKNEQARLRNLWRKERELLARRDTSIRQLEFQRERLNYKLTLERDALNAIKRSVTWRLIRPLRAFPLLAGKADHFALKLQLLLVWRTYKKAMQASRSKDWEEAIQLWSDITRQMKGRVPVKVFSNLARAYRLSGRHDDAENVLAGAMQVDDGDLWLAVEYARSASARMAWSDAASRWQIVIDRYGKKAPNDAWSSLAHALGAQGMVPLADDVIKEGQRKIPSPSTDPKHQQGKALLAVTATAHPDPAPFGLARTGHDASLITDPARGIGGDKQKKLPLTILVITWDVGHNPLGRSYMLAEVLDRVARNVVIVGFQFPRYGSTIWEPLKDSRIPVIALPGKNFPDFIESVKRAAEQIKPDLVVACKVRLPSLMLGLEFKQRLSCPVLFDIDDHELSFFKNQTSLTLQELRVFAEGGHKLALEAFEEIWTRFAESLCPLADHILVSNIALQKKFGGTIIPHVRDEQKFDPGLYVKSEARERFGIQTDAPLVLFFGTPRVHKGIRELAGAVGKLPIHAQLLVVGTSSDHRIIADLEQLAPGRILLLPNQPFDRIPEILAMADLVCLPQDENHPTSRYQLPAKAMDAIGMGVPVMATPTPPIQPLIEQGAVIELDRSRLVSSLEEWLTNDEKRRDWRKNVRSIFLHSYSYASAANTLRRTIQSQLAAPKNPVKSFHPCQVVSEFFPATPHTPGRTVNGHSLVVFWKQNDTTLYGRRHEMVIHYLASRVDVQRILVIEKPLSEGDLTNWRNNREPLTHYRWLYQRTYEKIMGAHDTAKIAYATFIHPVGCYVGKEGDQNKVRDYLQFLSKLFDRHHINPGQSTFLFYPFIDHADAILDHFKPGKVVVDVVDDHRTWPGRTEAELERFTRHYKSLLSRAHLAMANCEPVMNAMKEFFPGIHLVPNGYDSDIFPSTATYMPLLNNLNNWNGPVIGFAGNLEAKIDIALIKEVALHFREAKIVLIGSTHMNPATRQLCAESNIIMPGVIPHDQLKPWLERFDVGIIPHLTTSQTQSMNPLKAYLYLAHGIPVVATEVPNIPLDRACVRSCPDCTSFIAAIEQFLREKPSRTAFACFAPEISMKNRLDAIFSSFFKLCYPPKRA